MIGDERFCQTFSDRWRMNILPVLAAGKRGLVSVDSLLWFHHLNLSISVLVVLAQLSILSGYSVCLYLSVLGPFA